MLAPRRGPLTLLLAAAIGCGACNRPDPAPSACSLPAPVALAVAGKADGIYGVVGDRVDDAPLARFPQVIRTADGIDAANGKPWIRMRLDADASRSVRAFTESPEGKSIVVVVGGVAASQHKLRQPITGDEQQVSCCNPAACERWKTLLAAEHR